MEFVFWGLGKWFLNRFWRILGLVELRVSVEFFWVWVEVVYGVSVRGVSRGSRGK